jgi:uncharacterized YigZ family protein
MTEYLIPQGVSRAEATIQKSRFITSAAHAPTAEVAREFVETVRREVPDATHNCWAYVAGPPGSSAQVGMSDDGEPHGTAGRPMLNVLTHSDVGEIVAVCTRYYGGTKLGTGGLSRAYSSGVTAVMGLLATIRKVERVPVTLVIDYEFIDGVQRLLEQEDIRVNGVEYEEEVRYRLEVPSSQRAEFDAAIKNLTSGQSEPVDAV